MKLSKAAHEFTEGIRAIPGRSDTAKTYGSSLHAFVVMAHPDSVLAVNHGLVERFFQHMHASGQATNTVYRHATALRQFSKWGKRRGYWLDDWMDDPQFTFKQSDPMPKPFNEDEAAKIMAVPLSGVQHVARALLYYTGLRVTPTCALTVGNVNFTPLRIEDVSLPGSILATKNKGNKHQLVPMAEELEPILQAWLAESPGKSYDPLLHHSDMRPYSRSAVERWAREWGREAGVLTCHPHRFRHTYATDLLRKGVPLEVIQKLLGHVSILTTQRYTKLADASLIRALLTRSGKAPAKNL